MKNIEKYKETQDALDAWDKYLHGGGEMTFDAWAKHEADLPTLLEAAEAVRDTWCANMRHGSLSRVATAISKLSDAVTIEKTKPVRNCDKYRTAEEAWTAFRKMCNVNSCEKCPFGEYRNDYVNCRFVWFYAEADKEETK